MNQLVNISFVDNNSDLNLLKSLGNKSGLVQVSRTVQGKYGMYTRKQWVKASDVKLTDKVTHVPEYPMRESEGNKRNDYEEYNANSRVQSIKFKEGTVVETGVVDRKTKKFKKVKCIITNTHYQLRKTEFTGIETMDFCAVMKDKDGNVYTKNLSKSSDVKPEFRTRRLTKKEAEEYTGKQIFPTEYFIKTANSSKSYSEKDVIELYSTKALGNVSFDGFVKQRFFISDGYTVTNKSYKDENGNYIPERQELHDAIIQEIVDNAEYPPEGEPPTCYLFGGGSASGKSSVVNPIMEQIAMDSGIHFERVDSDDIKKQIPEYEAFQQQNADKAAFRVHDESSDIANEANDRLIEEGKCFAFDGTMKNYEKYHKLIDKLKSHGYKIVVIGVDIPTADAIKRSDARAVKTKRKVPHGIIEGSHGGFALTFPKLRNLVDDYFLYDNSQSEGELPTLVCSSIHGITDEDLWNKFTKKGTDYIKSKEGKSHGKR